ncbi:hypothetical protein [Paraliobacillus ryukyuensis]|uniref:hypothetical protein n=1 Tax=Paraliobacillus ryukyuensis TaxID=200904 RepID=UPI0009A839D8|nr:hypothetical protein [Paraliobacillus ryukyuensis]
MSVEEKEKLQDKLGFVSDESEMYKKLSSIALSLLEDEVYTKEDAAHELAEFINCRMSTIDVL